MEQQGTSGVSIRRLRDNGRARLDARKMRLCCFREVGNVCVPVPFPPHPLLLLFVHRLGVCKTHLVGPLLETLQELGPARSLWTSVLSMDFNLLFLGK